MLASKVNYESQVTFEKYYCSLTLQGSPSLVPRPSHTAAKKTVWEGLGTRLGISRERFMSEFEVQWHITQLVVFTSISDNSHNLSCTNLGILIRYR